MQETERARQKTFPSPYWSGWQEGERAMRGASRGWPGLEIQERTLGNVRAQEEWRRIARVQLERGCPGRKRSRCIKGTRGHSMAGRSQGRGKGMEQPSEEGQAGPWRPSAAGLLPWAGVSAAAPSHSTSCAARRPASSILVTVIVLAVLQERDLLQHPSHPSALCRPCRQTLPRTG